MTYNKNRYSCSDGYCGADDCHTCRPHQQQDKVIYSNYIEYAIIGRNLVLSIEPEHVAQLEELIDDEGYQEAELQILEELVANSELDFTNSEETGGLTEAPMLCIRDEMGEITDRWVFMDYMVAPIPEALIRDRKVTFVS